MDNRISDKIYIVEMQKKYMLVDKENSYFAKWCRLETHVTDVFIVCWSVENIGVVLIQVIIEVSKRYLL